MEKLKDRRLLLGQADLALAVGLYQHLVAGLEVIGADGESRVIGQLVTAQLGTDARQQNAEAERLGDVVVGTDIEAKDRVVLFSSSEAIRKVEKMFSVSLEYF